MSFDIFFTPCRFTGAKVKARNPFTGEDRSVLENEPLSETELRAVQQVLKVSNARWPEENGHYGIQFADGGRADFYGEELERGCMVALRGLTNDLLQFLFDLLDAGKWVMMPAMKDALAITTSNSDLRGVPKDSRRIIVCDSPAELSALLESGVAAWQEYRGRVIADDGRSDEQ